MKSNLVYFLIVVVLLGVVGYWYYRGKIAPPSAPEVAPSKETISAPTAYPTVVEEIEEKTDLEMIKEALAKKHGKPLGEVETMIEKITFPYAKGTVRFAGETGGGWWLAYKEKGGWLIVADGNGAVMCADIEPFDFPTDMVSECWDETSGSLVVRE